MPRIFVLIDDDIDDKELFREALTAVDPDILFLSAGDGEEALQKLERGDFHDPTVFFIDINLPEMSGWEVLTKIKRFEKYHQIPVLMYSTSSHERDKKIAEDLGAACLITKPDEYKNLKKILALVIWNLDTYNNIADLAKQLPSFQ